MVSDKKIHSPALSFRAHTTLFFLNKRFVCKIHSKFFIFIILPNLHVYIGFKIDLYVMTKYMCSNNPMYMYVCIHYIFKLHAHVVNIKQRSIYYPVQEQLLFLHLN